ncbi:MAG: hypothetical protein FWG92_02320 [Leptospirales bacterium]|nr:hypothetical protein [Leptospirales bacterium]
MRNAFFILLLLLVLPIKVKIAYCAEKYYNYGIEAAPQHENAPLSILGFAMHCASTGDFYRAYAELERLEGYYPGFVNESAMLVSKSYFLFNEMRYVELDAIYSSFPTARALWVFKSDMYFLSGDYNKMNDILNSAHSGEPFYNELLFKRRLLVGIMLESDSLLESLEELHKNEYGAYMELVSASKMLLAEKKSGALALACGIFPGGGYAYAGNFPTGFVAFSVIALSAVLTYTAYVTDNHLTAFFIGTVGTLFYGGSILGGYLEAARFNKEVREETAHNLLYRMSLLDDHKRIYERDGIGGIK